MRRDLYSEDPYDALVLCVSVYLVGNMLFLLFLWLLSATTPSFSVIIYTNSVGEWPYEVTIMCVLAGLGTIGCVWSFARMWRRIQEQKNV